MYDDDGCANYNTTACLLTLLFLYFLYILRRGLLVIVFFAFGVHQKQLPEQSRGGGLAQVEQTETAAFGFCFFEQVLFSVEQDFRSLFQVGGEDVRFAFDDVRQGEFWGYQEPGGGGRGRIRGGGCVVGIVVVVVRRRGNRSFTGFQLERNFFPTAIFVPVLLETKKLSRQHV